LEERRALMYSAIVAALLCSIASGAGTSPASQAAGRAVEVIVGDNMSFKPAAFAAKPGERITVVLKDVGKMPKNVMGHNFVLMAKGANAAAYVDRAAAARETEFIVPALQKQVLAYTKLVGPGETAEVTFTVPKEPGTYMFICTFPGHYAAGMKGMLTVGG